MAHNTGQCIPINIVVQDAISYIEKYSLDPSNTLLWMAKSRLTCNFRLTVERVKRALRGIDAYLGTGNALSVMAGRK